MPRLRDDERRARAHDRPALAQDNLDSARIVVVARELMCLRRWLDLRQVDDAALHFRDGFLRHDDDVVLFEPTSGSRSLDEQPREIVARFELRDAEERDDANLRRQEIPVTRMPACAR